MDRMTPRKLDPISDISPRSWPKKFWEDDDIFRRQSSKHSTALTEQNIIFPDRPEKDEPDVTDYVLGPV